jgi:hypothetical protein
MKKTVKLFFIAAVMIAVVVGYYFHLTSRNATSVETQASLTEVQKVIAQDLDKDYPQTPREVVKLYSRIISCYYNEECTDEELTSLAKMARTLMDAQLQENNPEDTFLEQVKNEVASYKNDGKTISNTSLSASNDVVYKTIEGRECAYVDVIYYIKQGTSLTASAETYLLRKDENDCWRILAFYLTQQE